MANKIALPIYSAKLYRGSSRKQHIDAAIQNPINVELVSQLASYVDPEYDEDTKALKEKEADVKESDEDIYDMDADLDEVFHVDTANHSPSTYTEDDLEAMMQEEPRDELTDELDAGEEQNSDTQVEESTSVGDKSPVTACLSIDTNELKGTLNSREDTAGVSRILKKESELWIYYNDNVNLNTVMSEVIEYLNAADQTYLEFNRLARSDNAIVFVINDNYSEMQPVSVEASIQVASTGDKSASTDSAPSIVTDELLRLLKSLIGEEGDDPVKSVNKEDDGTITVTLKSGKKATVDRQPNAVELVKQLAGIKGMSLDEDTQAKAAELANQFGKK